MRFTRTQKNIIPLLGKATTRFIFLHLSNSDFQQQTFPWESF